MQTKNKMTMKRIAVIAQITAKEGKSEELIMLLKELVRETRQEAGCLQYELLQSIDNCECFTMSEEWADESTLELHTKSLHFKAFEASAAELLTQLSVEKMKKVIV